MLKGSVTGKKNTSVSIELPLFFPPPLNAYLPLSIISSITLAHNHNHSWLYNNFIQLYQKPLPSKIGFYPNEDFNYADQSLLCTTNLSSQNYIIERENFVDNIIFWLNKGNYVIVYAAESEVPGTRFYNCKRIWHSQFVFGYNLTKKVFKIMNYSNMTDYLSIIDVSFDSLSNAFFSKATRELANSPKENWTKKDKDFIIILIRYKDNVDPSYVNRIDMELINKQLDNFINSRNSSLDNCFFTTIQKGTWGISVYNILKDHIDLNKGREFDYRQFHLLYEHKELMLLRFIKLKEEFNIDFDVDGFQRMKKLTSVMRNLCIRYNQTYDLEVADKIKSLIDELYEMEIRILNRHLEKYWH